MKTIYYSILLIISSLLQLKAQEKNEFGQNSTFRLKQENGQIWIQLKEDKKIISSSPQDTLPLLVNGIVYFIHNQPDKEGRVEGTLFSYNLKSGKKEDVLKGLTGDVTGIPKARIVQLLADEGAGRLFYTQLVKEGKKVPPYLTLVYNIQQKTLNEYRDGILESIDAAGHQTVVFYGKNQVGEFKMKTILDREGNIIQFFDDEYLKKF